MYSKSRISNEEGLASGVGERFREACDATTELVASHPGKSILTVFGVGFGLGLLLGYALAEPTPDTRGRLARFGESMLNALSGVMPESVMQRLGK